MKTLIETKRFGQSDRFGVILTLRTVEGAGEWYVYQVVRRGVRKGSRDCLLSSHSRLEDAERAFRAVCDLAAYYENGLSDRYAARIEGKEVKP